MSGKRTRSPLVFLVLLGAVFSAGLGGCPAAQVNERQKTEPAQSNAYDRVQRAADTGELTLKEAVLLKAELLFLPSLIPRDSKYAPHPGESRMKEEGMTGFYKDVHRVFPELSDQERKFLRTLSPDLEAIISSREKEIKDRK
jgi:hypothetical protein